MKKILNLILTLCAVITLSTSCGDGESVVLAPTIDESSIACDVANRVITFNADCPQGTKTQVLLRQLTNGNDERYLKTYAKSDGQRYFANTGDLTGGSTYIYYVIGYDSNETESSRSAEHTFSVPKNVSPNAPSLLHIKAYSPSSLVATDGRLEGDILTKEIEYSTDDGQSWTSVTIDGSITGLRAGKVLLRLKETATTEAGLSASVTVPLYQSNTDMNGDNGTSDGMR